MIDAEKLKELNERFRYESDKIDNWKILYSDDAEWRGDCDDYACTALYLLSDKSMWRFWWNLISLRAKLWRVISPNGVAHMRLHFDDEWICNIEPTPSKTNDMKLTFLWIAPFAIVKYGMSKLIRLLCS